MNGKAARMKGVWRKSVLAAIGSVVAFSAILRVESRASLACLRVVSAACFIELVVDMVGGEWRGTGLRAG